MRTLVHKKNFGLIWQNQIQVRIIILLREIGYLVCVCMNWAKSRERQLLSEILLLSHD